MDRFEQIIARCQQGDVEAFRQLVDQHQRYAYALAFRIVCDEEDAKDVVQESFIRVWRHIAGYDQRTKFTTWLYKIVVNLAYDVVKREAAKRRIFSRSATIPEPVEPVSASLSAGIVNRDLGMQIRRIVEGLPPRQRLVFVLRDLQDMKVAEVAEILEMSEASVKTNLCYARQFIRKKLAQMT